MKKLINLIYLFLFTFAPVNIAFAVNADDYTSLNNEIIAAAAKPAVTTIDLTTNSIVMQGNLSVISNKNINFQSASGTLLDGTDTYAMFTANSDSSLSFANISFKNALTPSENGSFVSLNASTATFIGSTTTFTQGFAVNGGGLSAKNKSNVTFSDAVVFDSNFAIDFGGGFYSDQSIMVFDDYAEFKNNVSEYAGGGFYSDAGSVISFNGHTYFNANTSMQNNGGGFYAYKSTITFKSAEFENNISSDIGGGFYSSLSNIVFTDSATFKGNYAKHSGGAFSAGYASNIKFEESVLISSNSSNAEGGGMDVCSSTISFVKTVEIDNNRAGSYGGGIFADEYSYLQFDDSTLLKNNTAQNAGGAIALMKSEVVMNGISRFENNSSQLGGAVYVNSGKITLGDTIFDGNNATAVGGAVYLTGNSTTTTALTINTSSETIFQNNKANNVSSAIYLDNYSSAEFNTAAGAAVQMHDAISGSGYNSAISISGAGEFNLYNKLNTVDVTLSGASGSTFNIMSGGAIDTGKFTIGSDSKFNAVNNGIDAMKVKELNIDGTVALDISHRGANDQIISSGDVNLGASSRLEINTDITDTAFRKKTYRLINSPTNINGTFAGGVSVTTPVFTYSPIMNYGDFLTDWVTITLRGDKLVTDFSSSLTGLSFNQKQTAKTYDALSENASGDTDAIISLIEGMDPDGQKSALAQASGYFLANVIRSAAVDAENNEIYDRIKNHCIYGDSESAVWAQLRGAATTYSKDENSLNDFNDTSSGVMIGFDRFMVNNNNIMLGVYGKYNTHDIEQGSSEADITKTGLGIYGGLIKKEWEVKALLSGSFDNYETKRAINFAGRKAKADFDGTTFGLDIEGAMKFGMTEFINLRPYIGLEAKNSHYSGFKEKGAQSLNLDVAGDSYVRSATRLGAGAIYDDNLFSWYANLEAKFLMNGDSPEIESSFEGNDLLFRSRGAEEGSMIFGAIVGASVRITKELKLFVNGSYYGADHFQNLYSNIGLRWNFCKPVGESKPVKPGTTKKDDFDPAIYLLALDPAEPKEMDAIITFEDSPVSSLPQDEYDPAIELLKSSAPEPQPVQQPQAEEYDAALELLNKSQQPEPVPVVAEEPKEINMEDAAVIEEQQKEAALRRSKPVLKSFSLNMANFATGKAKLTEKAKGNIRLQAEEIKNFKFEKITIEGHTDSTGKAALNKKLSRERAKAVFDVFVEEGIPAKKMSYIGFSSLLPIATNNIIEGRAQNRRVEIFVE